MTDQVIAPKTFNCRICGKSYKHQPALSTHQSKCQINKTCEEQAETIKQQAETIKHLTATIAKLTALPTTQSNQNVVIDMSNNIVIDKVEFHLRTFLYETCKKAPTYEKFNENHNPYTVENEAIALAFIKGNNTIEGLTNFIMDGTFKGTSISPFYNIDMKNKLCVKKFNAKTWIEEMKGDEGEDGYIIANLVYDIDNVFKKVSRGFSKLVDRTDTEIFPNGIIDYENARDDYNKLIDNKNIEKIIEKTVARYPKIQLPNGEVFPPIEECETTIIEELPQLEAIDD